MVRAGKTGLQNAAQEMSIYVLKVSNISHPCSYDILRHKAGQGRVKTQVAASALKVPALEVIKQMFWL